MARRGSTTSSSNRFGTLDSTHSDQSQMDDYESPYFLDNGDHPTVSLVSHHLTGGNYNTWNRVMSMALNAKNKLGFVDGIISCPCATDLLFGTWSLCNSMVISWILNVVSKEIADNLLYIDTIVEVWRDLHDRFH
ncbi:hypothetical protein PVL29_026323 [Vitis rotundifolia]|uniref:Retrotransposon Copia-like N-terminal domain-containing protein n=1 Tax=Vitis rotundifolia TaxID=103349 RepID=A0AA39D6Z9_VITRO|nr:hypothetical protein PVL29_026323 [Vitis rotundifolia]